MCFSAIAVANTILDMAAKRNIPDISPMKLQKLIFLAHALYVKKFDGHKLVSDTFEKWDYGPVSPEVYREFKGFGASPITRYASNADGKVDIVPPNRDDILNHLESILDLFGSSSAWRLSELTHMPNTAWDKAQGWYITDQNIQEGVVYSDNK